jgi:hypothetical protein
MKIFIIGTIDADFEDREEVLCERLLSELRGLGHETDLAYLPFKRDMLNAAEQILAYSLVDTTDAEAVVTAGYPACFISHHNEKKVSYLFDFYPEIHEDFIFRLREHRVEERNKVVEKIVVAEKRALKRTKKVFVNSMQLHKSMNGQYNIETQLLHYDDSDLAETIENMLLSEV